MDVSLKCRPDIPLQIYAREILYFEFWMIGKLGKYDMSLLFFKMMSHFSGFVSKSVTFIFYLSFFILSKTYFTVAWKGNIHLWRSILSRVAPKIGRYRIGHGQKWPKKRGSSLIDVPKLQKLTESNAYAALWAKV